MLKKSASGVLPSLRGLNLRMESHRGARIKRSLSARQESQESFEGRAAQAKLGMYLLASSLAAVLHAERRVLARRGWAGEINSLFEHPEGILELTPNRNFRPYCWHQLEFSAIC